MGTQKIHEFIELLPVNLMKLIYYQFIKFRALGITSYIECEDTKLLIK